MDFFVKDILRDDYVVEKVQYRILKEEYPFDVQRITFSFGKEV